MTTAPTTIAKRQVRSVASIALAICTFGLCIVGAVVMFASRVKFARLFDDMGLEMSIVSRFAIAPLLPVLLLFLAISGIPKELIPACRGIRDWWNLVLLLFGATTVMVYIVGVFSPLMSLIDGLS